jgi:hypothetical protein
MAHIENPRVVIALPSSGMHYSGTLSGIIAPSLKGIRPNYQMLSHSLLTRGFNILWCRALNDKPRPDYFAMMHADVCAQPGWLDILIEELEREDVEFVSTIIPIKDQTDRTSVCMYDPANMKGENLKRSEVKNYPPTFGNEVLPEGQFLLHNTGLWVCRFKDAKKLLVNGVNVKPWVEEFSFGQTDQIVLRDDGLYDAYATTEDWQMSLWMQDHGISMKATSKVKVIHQGTGEWAGGGEHETSEPAPKIELDPWTPAHGGVRAV